MASAVICSLIGLLSLWHIPHFCSQFYLSQKLYKKPLKKYLYLTSVVCPFYPPMFSGYWSFTSLIFWKKSTLQQNASFAIQLHFRLIFSHYTCFIMPFNMFNSYLLFKLTMLTFKGISNIVKIIPMANLKYYFINL